MLPLDPHSDVANLAALPRDYEEAWNARDCARLRALFASDARVDAAFACWWGLPDDATLETLRVETWWQAADRAVLVVHWRANRPGSHERCEGTVRHVVERRPDGWRIVASEDACVPPWAPAPQVAASRVVSSR